MSEATNNYTVYKHTAPNGKCYIGITGRDVKRRWHGGSAYRNNKHFFAAIKAYGWEAFTHEILAEGLSKEAACALERQLIAEYESNNPKHGYNLSAGGDKTTLGYHMSQATREKIRQKSLGRRKGIPLSEKHRRRIGEASRGHITTEATKAKLRAALTDGRFQTEIARKHQLENTPRGGNHPRARPVMCVETQDQFETIRAAAIWANCNRNAIARCAAGKQKTAKGYHWQFEKEIEHNE